MKFPPPLPTRILLIGSILIVILAGALIWYLRPLPDVVVTRTAKGFEPARITIRKGQAVVFKNETDTQIWPASDFHPTHTLYPEFDPKQPVPPGGSWRFVFSKVGVWTYHDHMYEYARAAVYVEGLPGEATAACLTLDGSTAPDKLAQCWGADLTEILRTKGLAAAFDEFAKLYSTYPAFRGTSCHDATHILGTAAYKEYSDNLTVVNRPETAYCGYGFYHGFMEAMLIDQGPSQFAKVRAYCESLKNGTDANNASGACYHGIGHAAFDSIPGEQWGDPDAMVRAGIATCESAATTTMERTQCSSGVFNAFAIAESSHTYGLAFPAHDPLAICRRQKEQYRVGCYVEHGIGVIREEKLDRAGVMKLYASIADRTGADDMLAGYMGDEAIRAISTIDLPAFYSFCASLPQQHSRHACDEGTLRGIRQAGEPGNEYPLLFKFCGLFKPGPEKIFCEEFTISQAKSTASDPDAFRASCEAIVAPELVRECS